MLGMRFQVSCRTLAAAGAIDTSTFVSRRSRPIASGITTTTRVMVVSPGLLAGAPMLTTGLTINGQVGRHLGSGSGPWSIGCIRRGRRQCW